MKAKWSKREIKPSLVISQQVKWCLFASANLFTLAQSRDIRDTATHTFYTEKQLKSKQRAAPLIGLS